MNIIKSCKSVYRHMRRHYLWYLRRKYTLDSISKRKGECKMCGCCQGLPYTPNCFNQETNKCLEYPDFPLFCKLYPIDEKDKNEFSKINCGFYWEDEK